MVLVDLPQRGCPGKSQEDKNNVNSNNADSGSGDNATGKHKSPNVKKNSAPREAQLSSRRTV